MSIPAAKLIRDSKQGLYKLKNSIDNMIASKVERFVVLISGLLMLTALIIWFTTKNQILGWIGVGIFTFSGVMMLTYVFIDAIISIKQEHKSKGDS